MKKLLLIIFAVLFIITGCGKKEVKLNVSVPKGDIVLICKKTDKSNGVEVSTTNTYNFGKDQYIINMQIDNYYKFSDNEQFKSNVDEIKKEATDIKLINNTLYDYNINEKDKTIVTAFAYTKMDIPETAISLYTVKSILTARESENMSCELSGISRENLF